MARGRSANLAILLFLDACLSPFESSPFKVARSPGRVCRRSWDSRRRRALLEGLPSPFHDNGNPMQGGHHTHQRRQDRVRHRRVSSGSGARRMTAEGMDGLLCRGTDVLCPKRHTMARTKRWCVSLFSLWAVCAVSHAKSVQVSDTEIMIWDK